MNSDQAGAAGAEPLERSESEPTESSAGPRAQPGRKRKEREPIRTLAEFFGRRAASAKTFLKDLREADTWGFADDDVRAALEIQAERDKDFTRTTRLIAAALKERDARFARPVVDFGELAIRRRLADYPRSIGVDLDAIDEPEQRLDQVARILSTRLQEAKRRAESTNLLLAMALCLTHTRGLAAQSAIKKLVARTTDDSSRSSTRQRARLVWLGEHAKESGAVLDLLAPLLRSADDLTAAVTRLEAEVNAEHEGRLGAESDVAKLSVSLADFQRKLADAHAEISRLEGVSHAAEVHADHDVKRVKARIAGILDGQLQDLVATVDEALSVDPPHVDVAREKAAVVVRELEKQVAWLKS